MVVCLASAWCVVFICFIKGIESMGKVCLPPLYQLLLTRLRVTEGYIICLNVSGCIRDSHIPLPSADYFPGPCPHSARSYWWTVVPLHSRCEFGHLLSSQFIVSCVPDTVNWCDVFTPTVVEHTDGASGVAGRCHPDLLLSLSGIWRPHSFLKLQSREVSSKTHYYINKLRWFVWWLWKPCFFLFCFHKKQLWEGCCCSWSGK